MSSIEDALLELREAERRKDSKEAFELVRGALSKLTDEDRTKLLDMPAVNKLLNDAEQRAKDQMRPGTAIHDEQGRVIAKVPWTFEAMKEEFGTVDWTPLQSRQICVNGIDLWVEEGRPVRTPPQFRDVAMEAWNAERSQIETYRSILKKNFGENSILTYGDGTPA